MRYRYNPSYAVNVTSFIATYPTSRIMSQKPT